MTHSLKPATSYLKIEPDGAAHLEGTRCGACNAVFVGRRGSCGRCGARDGMNAVHLGDRGHLYNYTIVYRSYPGVKVPFISAIVDLEGGGTVKGNLLDIAPEPARLAFGMPLQMVFRPAEVASSEGLGYLAHFFIPQEGTHE